MQPSEWFRTPKNINFKQKVELKLNKIYNLYKTLEEVDL